jgi:hypothetical protein
VNVVTFNLRRTRVKTPRKPITAPRRGDRGARQLAMAYAIDRWIEDGMLRDHAHAAALLGVTQARISQVVALLALAPDIQTRLLEGDTTIPERAIRLALRSADWETQRRVIQEYEREDSKRRRASGRTASEDRRHPRPRTEEEGPREPGDQIRHGGGEVDRQGRR